MNKPTHHFVSTCCCILLLLAGAATKAHATKFTGDQSTLWSNPANWEGGNGPGQSAEIPTGKLVDLDIPVGIGSVTMEAGSSIRNAGGSLSVSGIFDFRGGELGVDCQDPELPVSMAGTATLVFSGSAGKGISSCVVINNAGRIEWSGGPVAFDGKLNNSATGLFVIFGDAGFGSASRTGVINNAGRIVKETGTGVTQFSGFTPQTNQINTALNNTGTVAIASGTLEIGSGTSTGSFEIGSGAVLLVQGNGPHTFDGTPFSGGGKCSLAAQPTFLGEISSTVEMEVLGGIIGGNTERPASSLTGPGRVTWTSGAINGTFTFDDSVRTTLTGPALKTYDGTLVNRGTMEWAGPGPLATNKSVFRNEGTFNVLAAGTFLADTSSNGQTFENVGTLTTFPGGTSQTDDTLIVNSGTVNIGGYGSAGILTARLLQTATGSLQMEIGGAGADVPEFDQLRGLATADGTLAVDAINGYVPPKDARFTLVASHDGKFARVFLPGGTERFAIEYPGNSRTELVSLSDAPVPSRLWGAGRDLARNEVPDRDAERAATNARFPQWSYGYRSTAGGTNLTPFTPEQHINDNTGLHGWIGDGQATVAVNTRDTPIVFNTGSGDYKPLLPTQIYMSPGAANEYLVVRWTAPASGDYRVAARWLDLDKYGGNGATAHLFRNGQEEFVQSFASAGNVTGRARLRAQTFSLQAGDVLDFVVGSNGDNGFDATAFNAGVRRVPKATIVAPASELTVVEGESVTILAAVDHDGPVTSVALDIDGERVATKNAPPFEFVHQFEPGTHYVRVIAEDDRKAPGASAPVKVTATPAGASTAAARKPAGNTVGKAATSTGKSYTAKAEGGYWQNENTWIPQGVPGEEDSVTIGAGSVVLVSEFEIAGQLHLEGRIQHTLGGSVEPGLAVNRHLSIVGGEVRGVQDAIRFILRTGSRAKIFISDKAATFRYIDLDLNGKLTVQGGGIVSSDSSFINSGRIVVKPAPATQNTVTAQLGRFEQKGGATTLDPNTLLAAPQGIKIAGAVQLSPSQLVGLDSATLVGLDGGTLVGLDGGTLVGLDGGSLVGLDGGTLIGNDGSTLKGPDGMPLIGNDGSTLIGNDGSTLLAPDGYPSASKSGSQSAMAATAETANIVLASGTITGIGELRGEVLNQGGFISPGSSAGGIAIKGNYTQEAAGTLVLEIGGKTIAPFTYDILQVSGTASLGGKLVMKTIDNYTPGAADSVSPLLYSNVTGTFASVSANAQVAYGSNGMTAQVSGANPPAPKALNISTRMRVEAGDNALIAGFIVTGNAPKKVLIRGIGPSLPVSGALADPILSLDNGAVTNDDWKSTQEQEIRDTTIPPSSDLESAIVATLNPGPHTAILRGKNNGTGVGLVEVYDLEGATPVQLANISTRGQVQAGDNVMIGGFIIGGDYPARVLLRAIGPSLSVTGKLQDPTLELVDANGGRITNDDWRATQEAEIIATTVPPTNDKEAAIVATLVPGFYTAIVRGKDDTVGVALVEGYNLQ